MNPASSVSALLLFAGAVLLLLRPAPRMASFMWAGLLFVSLTHAAILSFQPNNLINNNNVQQYLGAKYVFRYADFQVLVNAARGQPEAAVRDLEHPMVILREDARAQRAYLIDLLRSDHVQFDPFTTLDSLRQQCVVSGVLQRESDRVLTEGLAPGSVWPFRRDVQTATPHLQWADITSDYGFNGSPFYALVRQLDPTVHRPFGKSAAIFGLCWQALSVGLVVWLLRLTFGLTVSECLATAALVFSAWDFVSYALPGLTFAGLWVPVAAAVLAIRRGRHALAGGAIAFAGLMKLFPFILLLPSVVAVAIHGVGRTRRAGHESGDARGAWITMIVCLITTFILGALSSVGGRSWLDFMAKVGAQFGPGSYIMNSVSASHGLLALGIDDSWLVKAIPVLVFALIVVLCTRMRGNDGMDPARFHWVLIASTGFVTHLWLNYYAIAPLFLLPFLARRHPRGAALAAALFAFAYLLPDFDDAAIYSPRWRALKLAPYSLVPAWLLFMEVRERVESLRLRRTIAVVAGVTALVVVGEAVFRYEVRQIEQRGSMALDAGDARAAEVAYTRLLRRRPTDAAAEMNLGIALAQLGRMDAAGARFARAAELAPTDPIVVQNYALWLRRTGRRSEAAAQFGRLRDLVPWNDDAWVELAALELELGRAREAGILVSRALELRPDNHRALVLRDRAASQAGRP